MNNNAPHTDLAATLRMAMGPGFNFNTGAAIDRLAAQSVRQTRRA